MDNAALFKNILKYLRTKQEANAVKDALETYLNTRFLSTKQSDCFTSLPQGISQFLTSQLSNNLTSEQTKASIEYIVKQLSDCPVIHATIAFSPSDSMLDLLSAKARQHVSTTLLDMTVDKSIIGGAIIIQNGMYKDFSIKKKLQSVFEKNTVQINELLV